MRSIRVSLVLVFCASIAAAQNQKPPKTITLSGCVERGDNAKPDELTLTDAKAHKTYRLTGSDLREYIGRRVQIDGGIVVKGVRIQGGLQPNPNIAAQAGAIDPARAAVQAATSGTGPTATTDVPEFRVKTVKATEGTCQ
jgi:outer membrane protein TolC